MNKFKIIATIIVKNNGWDITVGASTDLAGAKSAILKAVEDIKVSDEEVTSVLLPDESLKTFCEVTFHKAIVRTGVSYEENELDEAESTASLLNELEESIKECSTVMDEAEKVSFLNMSSDEAYDHLLLRVDSRIASITEMFGAAASKVLGERKVRLMLAVSKASNKFGSTKIGGFIQKVIAISLGLVKTAIDTLLIASGFLGRALVPGHTIKDELIASKDCIVDSFKMNVLTNIEPKQPVENQEVFTSALFATAGELANNN